ncbi:hypothetical protein GCM10022254_20280 [Actinomadura meridiana]|uniref:Uncharacterized protein n=1 Tax=Actinomadura meridiana TaxID=559626 RepID=A0ABP8BWX5_9ACTN
MLVDEFLEFRDVGLGRGRVIEFRDDGAQQGVMRHADDQCKPPVSACPRALSNPVAVKGPFIGRLSPGLGEHYPMPLNHLRPRPIRPTTHPTKASNNAHNK